MDRSLLILAVMTILALTGCAEADDGSEDPSPTATDAPTATEPTSPTTPSPTAASPTDASTAGDGATTAEDPAEMTFAECAADRFSVGYPEGWNTNDPGGQLDACRIFHPGEIDVPDQPQDRDLHYAVSMYVDAVEYGDAREGHDRNEVLEEREITVDGRDAFVAEYRGTGETMTPEGERWYSYIVDLGDGEILVAVTYSVGETDYERDKAVLDRMMTEELTLDG